MDIKEQYKNLTPVEAVKTMWRTSTKKGVAYNYILGAIDALRCVNAITEQEYNTLYDKLYKGGL